MIGSVRGEDLSIDLLPERCGHGADCKDYRAVLAHGRTGRRAWICSLWDESRWERHLPLACLCRSYHRGACRNRARNRDGFAAKTLELRKPSTDGDAEMAGEKGFHDLPPAATGPRVGVSPARSAQEDLNIGPRLLSSLVSGTVSWEPFGACMQSHQSGRLWPQEFPDAAGVRPVPGYLRPRESQSIGEFDARKSQVLQTLRDARCRVSAPGSRPDIGVIRQRSDLGLWTSLPRLRTSPVMRGGISWKLSPGSAATLR